MKSFENGGDGGGKMFRNMNYKLEKFWKESISIISILLLSMNYKLEKFWKNASKAHFVKIADFNAEKAPKAREWQIRVIDLKETNDLLK